MKGEKIHKKEIITSKSYQCCQSWGVKFSSHFLRAPFLSTRAKAPEIYHSIRKITTAT